MSAQPPSPALLLVGADRPLGLEIGRRLDEGGWAVTRAASPRVAPPLVDGPAGGEPFAAVVLVAPSRVGGDSFLSLPDQAFTDRIADLGEVFALLQDVLPRLSPGASLVIVTSRGFLGAWGGADEMAFSAALVALARCVGLENTPRGVRANVVAADFAPQDFGGDARAGADKAVEVASTVAFLVGPESAAVRGEVILANGGRSLQRREARDRRTELSG